MISCYTSNPYNEQNSQNVHDHHIVIVTNYSYTYACIKHCRPIKLSIPNSCMLTALLWHTYAIAFIDYCNTQSLCTWLLHYQVYCPYIQHQNQLTPIAS